MIEQLIVGGNGLVGSALRAHLTRAGGEFAWTSRQGDAVSFDLLRDSPGDLPDAEIVYLVAAVASLIACEKDPVSTWRVNVDAPIALARHYRRSFVVYVSSDAVESAGRTEYGRQKSFAEAFMLTRHAAIVRPCRIGPERAAAFAGFLAGIGTRREAGLYRWS